MNKNIMKPLGYILLTIAWILITRHMCMGSSKNDFYMTWWIVAGIPFGFKKMRYWLVPKNFGVGPTIGIWALNIMVGGVIGGFVIITMTVKNIISLVKAISTNSSAQID